jgi:hypothetical protein
MRFADALAMSVVSRCRSMLGAGALAGLVACQPVAPPSHLHGIVIQAETAGHAPLEGVAVTERGRSLGQTAASGALTLELRGSEGQRVELEARCPASFVPERTVVSVTLRRLQASRKLPTYRVDCQPATRTAVVAVRATNGPDLPVIYLGREVARTDSSGVAHVALTLRPGERFELGLDTTGKSLVPTSPRAAFVAGTEDELVFFDQRFHSRKLGAAGGHGGTRPRLPTAF